MLNIYLYYLTVGQFYRCHITKKLPFLLRNYYKFVDYRLFISICAENEEEAQKKARELDSKIDFDFSYLEPPIKDEDPINT